MNRTLSPNREFVQITLDGSFSERKCRRGWTGKDARMRGCLGAGNRSQLSWGEHTIWRQRRQRRAGLKRNNRRLARTRVVARIQRNEHMALIATPLHEAV